jgi:protease PrsW
MALFLLFVLFIILGGGLAWYLIAHDRGEKEPIGSLWIALGLGLFAAIPTIFLERQLLDMSVGVGGVSAGLLFTMLGVGIIEEACKFIPLAIYLYKKRFFNEHTDGVIYFALAGLGFGVPENILYTAQFGAKVGMARVFLTPIFHAATTALVGYFFVKYKIQGKSPFLVLLPLSGAMVLHGLYNFGLGTRTAIFTLTSMAIAFGLSGMLFILYLKANERDQVMGLSVAGNNSFCRTCGKPNPQHHLYCTQCGKIA